MRCTTARCVLQESATHPSTAPDAHIYQVDLGNLQLFQASGYLGTSTSYLFVNANRFTLYDQFPGDEYPESIMTPITVRRQTDSGMLAVSLRTQSVVGERGDSPRSETAGTPL